MWVVHWGLLLNLPWMTWFCLCECQVWKWCRCLGHSQQQPSLWGCPTIPKLQLPDAVPSREPASLSGVYMAAARTVWFSLHLGCHRSAVSLSAFNVSPLTQTIVLMWGSDPCFRSPTLWGQIQSTDTSVFPPSSLVLPSFAWFYIFFSTGQVLLSILSWCSPCTSVFKGVFLMYPWGEIYSRFTYFSAILFFLRLFFFFNGGGGKDLEIWVRFSSCVALKFPV